MLALISNRMTETVNRMAYWNNKILASALFTDRRAAQSPWSTPCSLYFIPGIYGSSPVTYCVQTYLCLPREPWRSQCPRRHGALKSTGLPKKGKGKAKGGKNHDFFSWSSNQTERCMPTEINACPLYSSGHLVQSERPQAPSKAEARLLQGQQPETSMCTRSASVLRKDGLGPLSQHFQAEQIQKE